MYQLVSRLDPDDVEAVTALAYKEMLERGFTAVGEFHYLHHASDGRPFDDIGEMAQRIAAAAQQTGIGLTLLPVFYAHSNFGASPPLEGQRRFVSNLDTFNRLIESCERAVTGLPYARLGIAPHSLRAVTPEQLCELSKLASGPIHIHAAEQLREVSDSIAYSGLRPVEWLLREQDIDARWCLIHATHMTADEVSGFARSGAVAGLCPVTEANLGDGTFDLPGFTAAGGIYGVGTDSNVMIDVAAELRQLEYSQRLSTLGRNVAAKAGGSTGSALFLNSLAGGSQALDRGPSAIAAGNLADIVTFDTTQAALAAKAKDSVLDSWIFSSTGCIIDCVWSMGRKVVCGGRHTSGAEIEARFRRVMEKLTS